MDTKQAAKEGAESDAACDDVDSWHSVSGRDFWLRVACQVVHGEAAGVNGSNIDMEVSAELNAPVPAATKPEDAFDLALASALEKNAARRKSRMDPALTPTMGGDDISSVAWRAAAQLMGLDAAESDAQRRMLFPLSMLDPDPGVTEDAVNRALATMGGDVGDDISSGRAAAQLVRTMLLEGLPDMPEGAIDVLDRAGSGSVATNADDANEECPDRVPTDGITALSPALPSAATTATTTATVHGANHREATDMDDDIDLEVPAELNFEAVANPANPTNDAPCASAPVPADMTTEDALRTAAGMLGLDAAYLKNIAIEILPARPSLELRTGACVELVGLSTTSLNGQLATVTSLRANDRGRWIVATIKGRMMSARPSNLRVMWGGSLSAAEYADTVQRKRLDEPAGGWTLPDETSSAAASGRDPDPDATAPEPPAATARTCSWSECGKTLSTNPDEQDKCGQCKQQYYCSRKCQKKHWGRGGHKHNCKEPPCCTICLDGGDEPLPIQGGCGCRGDAGLAHVACKAEMNAHKGDGYHTGWWECPTCGQGYTGAMRLGLAREIVQKTSSRGKGDNDRVGAADNLGTTLREAGRYAEAAEVQAEVVAALKCKHGSNDMQYHAAATNLAITYGKLGKYAEAGGLQEKTLAVFKRVLGYDHTDTIGAKANLALTYTDQGLHTKAERLQRQVLAAFKRVLGDTHHYTIDSIYNLCLTLTRQGKNADAVEIQADGFQVSRRVKGADHPDTLAAAHNLAATYSKLHRHVEAIELMTTTLEGRTRVLGLNHPETYSSRNSLVREATLYFAFVEHFGGQRDAAAAAVAAYRAEHAV